MMQSTATTILIVFLTSMLSSAEPAPDSLQTEKNSSLHDTQQTVIKDKQPAPDPESANSAPADTSAQVDTPVNNQPGTAQAPDSAAESMGFVNPFLTDVEKESVMQKDTVPAGTSAEQPALQKQNIQDEFFEDEKKRIDIIVDLGIGVSMPLFKVKPDNISTEGKPKFIFNPGIIIPFGKRFYTGIAFRYLQLAVELNQNERFINPGEIAYTNINARENLTFITLPLQFGMRFETGPITPYFYGNVEPALLTAGHQFSKLARAVYYDDGSKYFDTLNSDINITKIREQFQVFIGGGIGLEFFYGYGMVYIDCSVQYALNDIDKPDNTKSLPLRRSCKAFYFPLSLGVRFYL